VIELFLIRHARAVEQAANDWERPLMAEGRTEARAVGAVLAQEGVRLDTIATSPLVRAVETATLVAVEVGYAGGLTVDHGLTPDGSTGAILALCAQLPGERVALVGHEPSMGQLLSDLLGRPGMSMVKGGIARLAIDGAPAHGGARLVWSISPRQLKPARGG
jgi:phosphohistidine phosphatase